MLLDKHTWGQASSAHPKKQEALACEGSGEINQEVRGTHLKLFRADGSYDLYLAAHDLTPYPEVLKELAAIGQKPQAAETHYSLGVGYCELGRNEEALAALREALRIRPDYAEAHHALGATYVQSGRDGEALPAFQRAK
ncbi:MAG: tetratricopeptide repeat protein [Gemmatimonadales bacterium]|nr:tetratricopeptide repeat protein [Gemmatimonadales bacterium]